MLTAVPGGAVRTEPAVDAEVSASELCTESGGVEAPVPEPVDAPVVVEAPSVPSEAVDDGGAESALGELPSSAQATAGLLATATPTPNATANPPTRPTKRPALMTASRPALPM
ncbi:hypothetical protein [Mycobacterium sp. OAE908]|uniref:hypothetical protein n=1 Tax=Mycobacterium sp. OAE908 TaxID=2817899 RepID=UPI001AE3A403